MRGPGHDPMLEGTAVRAGGALFAALDSFAPSSLLETRDSRRRFRIVVGTWALLSLVGISLIPLYALTQRWISLWATLIGLAVLTVVPACVRFVGSVECGAHVLCGTVVVGVIAPAAMLDGVLSTGIPWLTLVPMLATIMGGIAFGIGWTAIAVATLTGLQLMHTYDGGAAGVETASIVAWTDTALIVAVLVSTIVYEWTRSRAEEALEAAHRELELQRARHDTEGRLAALGTLAAGVAHEINNPLSYVHTNLVFLADQLRRDRLEPELREELAIAAREAREGAEQVRDIVGDLRVFARADDDVPASIDPARAVQMALRLVGGHLRHKARVETDLEDSAPVIANESRLVQVLVNLLSNAGQAFATHEVSENRVRVALVSGPAGATIEVHDNAGGMSEEVLGHIFEPFFTTKPVGIGTGLGLAISRELVQAMGGELTVESEEGRGSSFRIFLRWARAATPSAPKPSECPPMSAHHRILIVDDEPLVARSLQRLLRKSGDVTIVDSGKEALTLLTDGDFDFVLCDVMLRDMIADELFEKIQRLRPDLAAHVGFMSGGAVNARAAEFIERMGDRFIEKPISRSAAMTLVGTHARGHLEAAE